MIIRNGPPVGNAEPPRNAPQAQAAESNATPPEPELAASLPESSQIRQRPKRGLPSAPSSTTKAACEAALSGARPPYRPRSRQPSPDAETSKSCAAAADPAQCRYCCYRTCGPSMKSSTLRQQDAHHRGGGRIIAHLQAYVCQQARQAHAAERRLPSPANGDLTAEKHTED